MVFWQFGDALLTHGQNEEARINCQQFLGHAGELVTEQVAAFVEELEDKITHDRVALAPLSDSIDS